MSICVRVKLKQRMTRNYGDPEMLPFIENYSPLNRNEENKSCKRIGIHS